VPSRSTGVSYPAINASQVARIPTCLPGLNEQDSIATFLDNETAKIDALIAEQQRLIELLQEKRQSVISHAVTKGLNPDVPMKDSGVEWLGEVPEHWEVKRLIHVTQGGNNVQMGPFGGMLKGHATSPTEYRLYGQENTISNNFEIGGRWLEREHFQQLREYELLPGDVVLTRKGASIGNCRIVPDGIHKGVIDSDTIRVRFDESLIDKRLASLLMHEGYLEVEIMAKQKGAVLPGLNTMTISNLLIALPPIDEQLEIVGCLEVHLGRFEHLVKLTTDAVLLLQERRSALVSAAVTGQIDVRRLVPAEEVA
jgi:type I restriction enzyme, S subunit